MLEYWYDALRSTSGIAITVSDQEKAKRLLYAARKEAHDESLDAISIRVPPNNPDQLWLVHNACKERTVPPSEGDSQTVRG